ncbi:MAG: ATPase [SAR86 cluster bacterium]|uniref:histidine kinase n=1 Tax=SAR86 cluster bacterium TaxID=2030880 RepID=A0A2A5B285_9GAMM|nr:MAG: ATPase [SAR86 cluster bacterium]
MNYELTTIVGLGSGYLALLFGIAFATERGLIPEKIVRHPIVYTLSLGVFASVWAYYTSIGNALRDGYGYLAQSIGISLVFLLSPLLLRPLLELTRTYQLSSLADLMAFRYRSPWAGTVTTLVILIGVTPLIALQIRAVADTAGILSPELSQASMAFGFCVIITLFSILFGTSRRGSRTQHDGLVMAIAFESLVKLVAFLAVGAFAIFGGFGGMEGLEQWLQDNPHLITSLKETNYLSSFHIMSLLFFTAAVAMPHMFYVTFNENNGQRALSYASWGLPLYFLLLSLPVLPILWAGLQSGSEVQVEYFPVVIGVAYDVPFFTVLAYLGGLSAASGLIIVITLALSNMCLNHLILPIYQPTAQHDIYRWLLWKRRVLITALIWSGFLFRYLPNQQISLQVIGTISFTAGLQFLPGIVAILYWPQANKKGFMSGLGAGVATWFIFLTLPLLTEGDTLSLVSLNWHEVAAFSLILNSLFFVVVSLRSTSTDEERSSADICTLDTIKRRKRSGLVAKTPNDFIKSLSKPLGDKTANREVSQALKDLDISHDDRRPYAMRLLRGRLEANLSGLLGPSIARELIDGYLPYSIVSQHGTSDLNVIENRIEAYRSNLSGMAADLDNLRRYHRQILLDLPLGVCSLSSDDEIIMWNRALEDFTKISSANVIGSQLADLPEPWLELLENFIRDDAEHSYKHSFDLNGHKKTVNLHKALIEKSSDLGSSHEGIIILIEDITEIETLEAGLSHSERLASIGRLAAGVAHEIGNPITGIACLAQTIRDEFEDNELQNLATQIIEQTNRTSKILQALVNFAHAGTNQTHYENEIVIIADCMEEARTLIFLDTKNKDLQLHIESDPQAKISGDSQRLLQVLLNLVSNARDASQADGEVSLQASVNNDQVRITVTDEGIGIPPIIRDRIFDPFFTTKEAGDGTGLGLSLVFSIVEDLKGDIDIISPANKATGTGTQVILRFPCYHGDMESVNDSMNQ